MGVKISDATPKGSSDGTELIGVSDSLSAKSISTANIKNYVIDQIEAIAAAGSVTGADEVMINQGGTTLKPVDIDLVAQHAIDTIWAKGAEATPVDADVMALKDDGGVERTVVLSVLAEYVRAAIEADILDISDLADGEPTLAVTDYMLVTQGSTAKQITFQDVNDAIYAALAAHIIALGAIGATADADLFYTLSGGTTPKKVTLAQIVAHLGTPVTKAGATTENYVPQWTANDGELKPGLIVATAGFGAGAATSIADTAAIRASMDTIVNDATDIGVAVADTDEILVYDASGTAQKKSEISRIWTWALIKLKAITDLSTYSWFLDDDTMAADSATKCASQQSIKAYVDGEVYAGDITTLDIDGGSEISAALADADLIIVDDGGVGTNKSSLVSRIWTYIQTKLGTLYVAPGAGITDGSPAICVISAEKVGSLYKTTIVLDIQGLRSTALGDIIGDDGTSSPCYITQITQALSGSIVMARITCVETPTGGDPDIDLYAADEGTGTEDDAISGLTATKLTDHADWTEGDIEWDYDFLDYPAADQYLYLVAGDTTDADYTAGKFRIELWGN